MAALAPVAVASTVARAVDAALVTMAMEGLVLAQAVHVQMTPASTTETKAIGLEIATARRRSRPTSPRTMSPLLC